MIEVAYIAQLQKKYTGFLRSLIRGEPFNAIRLRGGLEKPDSTKELHQSIASFLKYEKTANQPGWSIDWKPWSSKKFSAQRWPDSISVTTEEDFLFILDKEAELTTFRVVVKRLLSWNFRIVDWLSDHPASVLKYKADWNDICAVIDFFLQEDARSYYIRSLPIPVHTKFIDQYASVILSLLKTINPERFPSDVADLETAVGLRKKPHLYALRWLDDALAGRYSAGFNILALPYITLQTVPWNTVEEVWIVENETNLYLLHERKNALGIFARGYALHNLKEIPLFRAARLFYWGDLDEDGYLMLDQFRQIYPHTTSILMDDKTVRFHIEQTKTIHYRFRNLNLSLRPEELAGYNLLLEKNGRIEQEQLQQQFVQEYIQLTA